MERSKIALHKWVLAAHFMASSKKGMSALQLQRMMGLSSYESAWFLFHRLREATKRPGDAGPMGGEGATIEADEPYFGGKEKNRHAKDRDQSMSADRKFPVMVLVERNGEARSFHMASVTAKTVCKVLTAQVSRKSNLMTDGATVYVRVGAEFAKHGSTDHAKGEYWKEGGIHSNTAESYFAILKRGVYGSFHSISEAHLHRYLSEFDFRYSTRKITDVERADLLIAGVQGKRLMYRQPHQA
jgi:transposase-like protein